MHGGSRGGVRWGGHAFVAAFAESTGLLRTLAADKGIRMRRDDGCLRRNETLLRGDDALLRGNDTFLRRNGSLLRGDKLLLRGDELTLAWEIWG